MNGHSGYLKELEEDLTRVIGFLSQYRSQVSGLKGLNYTPNTRRMLKGLKYRLESTDFTKLTETVGRGVDSL